LLPDEVQGGMLAAEHLLAVHGAKRAVSLGGPNRLGKRQRRVAGDVAVPCEASKMMTDWLVGRQGFCARSTMTENQSIRVAKTRSFGLLKTLNAKVC
jgi:hypothetical protein